MASKVGICNLALSHIGQRSISAINESSAEAAACRQFYDRDRRAVLRAHPWNFALRVVTLAASVEDPEYGYTYRYKLPTDCLRPVELTNLAEMSADPVLQLTDANRARKLAEASAAFKLMGKDLLTNVEGAKLAYVKDETDPNQFDELFLEALSFRIAADLAGVLPESPDWQKNMIEMYERSLASARAVDAAETRQSEAQTMVSVRS